jgi:acetoin utilization deacetylase AcuC-like enzyme
MLTDADFADLTKVMRQIADQYAGGRLVSLLEGGYSLEGLAAGVRAHVEALLPG